MKIVYVKQKETEPSTDPWETPVNIFLVVYF